jgi:hypothetical protein
MAFYFRRKKLKGAELTRQRYCTEKRAFSSAFYAALHALNVDENSFQKVYHCNFCQEHHLTKSQIDNIIRLQNIIREGVSAQNEN